MGAVNNVVSLDDYRRKKIQELRGPRGERGVGLLRPFNGKYFGIEDLYTPENANDRVTQRRLEVIRDRMDFYDLAMDCGVSEETYKAHRGRWISMMDEYEEESNRAIDLWLHYQNNGCRVGQGYELAALNHHLKELKGEIENYWFRDFYE